MPKVLLDSNVPVGAGVMDCPVHSSATKHALIRKITEYIYKGNIFLR